MAKESIGPAAPPPLGQPGAVGGIGRKVVAGAAIMVAGRLGIRLISIVSTLLLVRLLVPEDFGLIGLAAAAFAVVDMLTSTNYAMAVIRRPTAEKAVYDTAWTLNLLRCLLLGGLVAGTAEWQADLLGDRRIGPVLMVVALTVALDGFVSVGMFRLQRDLQFAQVFRFQLVNRIVAFLVTIGLAFVWQNYWCLVLGNLAAKLVLIPYSYWLAPHRPRFSFHAAGELLHFSKWMLAANFCSVADTQIPSVMLGRWGGLQALGMFQVAYQIAAAPVNELAVPVRGPVYAGYSQIHQDRQLLRDHFLAGLGFLVAVVTPLSVGIALTAPEIEALAMGPGWAGAAPLIALCALYALADCVAHFTHNVFIVLDAQRRLVLVFAALLLLRVPAVLLATLAAGATGFAAALLATAVVNAGAWNWQAARLMGLPLAGIGAELWRTAAAAVAMAIVVLGSRMLLPPHSGSAAPHLLTLGLLATLGAATHIGAQYLLWRLSGTPPGAERRMLSLVGQALARLFPKLSALSR